MTHLAAQPSSPAKDPPATKAAPAAPVVRQRKSIRLRAAHFWIQSLVRLSQGAPVVARTIRTLGLWFAWNCSSTLRDATLTNSARLLGPRSTPADQRRLALAMIASFYDFLMDMGRHRNVTPDDFLKQVASVEGEPAYLAARAAGRGAILVTAHLGSFEIGAAAIRQKEPIVHVVFQRDPMPVFEQLRADQHRRLGLTEAAVDPASGADTWTVWLKLRDALLANEVVLMQGDRVMPGQRGRKMPFMGGHVMFPPGPIKLAQATGAPIIPVFAPRQKDGRVRIVMADPIWVADTDTPESASPATPNPAEIKLARVIEEYVSKYPEQWMMIHRVWCEDQVGPGSRDRR